MRLKKHAALAYGGSILAAILLASIYDRVLAGDSAAKPVATSQPIPLGKVVELTVNDDSKDLGDCCIDFETGQLFSIPKQYQTGQATPPPVIKEWIVPNGIDAIGETKAALKGLFGFHMVAIPIHGPADKLPEVSAANLSSQFVDTVPGLPVLISGRGELPATYLFQTREGSRGVLQIIGFSEAARGVRIRYKLLSSGVANRD